MSAKKKKMIQNYQLLEVVGQVQGKYENFKAKNIVDKKFYTVKKVKTKNDKYNKLYEGFLHQATLLKGIKHHHIIKSIKMMKTASSIYVVYDYCDGETLEQWMEKGRRTVAQKENVIKQICLVLAEMKKTCIAHLALNPGCIYVSDVGDVKITGFVHGTDLPENEGEIQLMDKVPKSEYVAPEVKKGMACIQSDVYSFGKIMEFIDIENSKKGNLTIKEQRIKVQQFRLLIRNMVKKHPQQRDPIQQAFKLFFKKKGKFRKMQSMSMSLSRLNSQGKESMLSRNSRMSSVGGSRDRTEFVNDLVLRILKRRSMAKLLVLIMGSVVDSNIADPNELLILGTILLKKSTMILNGMGKFMKYGKGIQGIDLNERQRARLFKSSDFFKLQPIVDKQLKFQKKLFEKTLESIYLDKIKLLHENKKFNQQVKRQQLDETYLNGLIRSLLKKVANQSDLVLQQLKPSLLKILHLMSAILDHGGIDLLFEKKINNYPVDVYEQPIILKIFKETRTTDIIANLRAKYLEHAADKQKMH